jgi:enoyl-CoA hydratase/carnithine racemase
VLTGTGDFFTAGNDLQDFLAHTATDEERPAFRFMRALLGLDKPIVAAVNGPGIGIGTTMLLHCDFAYAAPSAYLHMPFVDLALVPEFASSLTVPLLVGRVRAAELLLLGEKLSAEEAVADGFVNAIADEPLEAAMNVARRLAAKAPGALRRAKALMRRPIEEVEARILAEGELFTDQLSSPEARETMQAFLEKRPPDYSRMG